MSNKVVIDYTGDLRIGYDGEFYITPKDDDEHDLAYEATVKLNYRYPNSTKRARIIIMEEDDE